MAFIGVDLFTGGRWRFLNGLRGGGPATVAVVLLYHSTRANWRCAKGTPTMIKPYLLGKYVERNQVV